MSLIGALSYFRNLTPNFCDIIRSINCWFNTKDPRLYQSSWRSNEAFWELLFSQITVLRLIISYLDGLLKGRYMRSIDVERLLWKMLPLQFESRCLMEQETKYPPLEWEALAIIWALNKFRLWREGCKITPYEQETVVAYLLESRYRWETSPMGTSSPIIGSNTSKEKITRWLM